jgi:STE24 endopeptidase
MEPMTRAAPATRRWLTAAIALPLLWSLALCLFAWQGTSDPDWYERVRRYFTPEDIARGAEYHRAFIPGAALRAVITWGILGLLVLAGGARRLADRALALTRGRWLLAVALTALFVGLGLRLAAFPISFFHGYILEGGFGFRRLDLLPWIAHLVKSWGVGVAFEVGAVTLFFAAIRRFPRRWLPITIGGGAALSFILAIIWQPLILPLFYRVSPLPAGELRDGVAHLAERAGVPVQEIRLIDQSRISGHTNAFFSGIGDRREIYLYDTLNEQHEVPEVLAVVAHEIGHWRHQHVLKGWALGVLGTALGLFLLKRLLDRPSFLAQVGAADAADPALVPLLWALTYSAMVAVSPIENAVSRRFEREADRDAVELIDDPATFITMKVDSARANRSQLLPHPVVVFWNATHPPVIERIELAAGRR